jgi:hypothetical protein
VCRSLLEDSSWRKLKRKFSALKLEGGATTLFAGGQVFVKIPCSFRRNRQGGNLTVRILRGGFTKSGSRQISQRSKKVMVHVF